MGFKSLDIVVPESLKNLVNQVLEERLKERQRQQQTVLAERKREVEKELFFLREGLPYAKQIFEWAEAFYNNFDCLVLIGVGGKHRCQNGISFFKEKILGESWRELGISHNGLWWMGLGCGARERYVETPEQLALEVNPKILKKVCEIIESGEIWDNIKKNWTD